MANFIYIFMHIILPIFIMVGIGYILQKNFKMEISSFSKLQIYVLMPSLVFLTLYTTTLSKALVSSIVFYTMALFFTLTITSTLIAKLLGMSRVREKSFINAVTLRNTGNFGIPLITLIFAGATSVYAISIHMIAMTTSTILMYTFGLYNASSGKYTARQALKSIIKIPTIHMILAAVLCRYLQVEVSEIILEPINYFSKAVVPVALFTLGAQLAESKFEFNDLTVYLGNAIRLIVSPLIAFALSVIMQLDAVSSQVLIIGAATPTAVNSVLMAIEFDGDADYASQTVFLSTLVSSITISMVIYLLHI